TSLIPCGHNRPPRSSHVPLVWPTTGDDQRHSIPKGPSRTRTSWDLLPEAENNPLGTFVTIVLREKIFPPRPARIDDDSPGWPGPTWYFTSPCRLRCTCSDPGPSGRPGTDPVQRSVPPGSSRASRPRRGAAAPTSRDDGKSLPHVGPRPPTRPDGKIVGTHRRRDTSQ